MQRRFEAAEGLFYDASRDIVYLRGGYRGVRPVVSVRSIIMDSDVVHLNDIMVKDEVVIRGGSIIKGNVLAEGRILVEASDAPTLIAGDIGVVATDEGGDFIVREGQPLIILGSIMAKSIDVRSPTLVLGNIAALSKVMLRADTLVLGRVIVGSSEKPGYLEAERASLHHCYAFGNVNFGRGVTVSVPLVAAKGGKIKVEDHVRVLSFPCIFCSEVDDPLLCEYYLEGRCPLREKGASYDYLSFFDLASAGDYEYLSWFWRASPLMVLQNVLAKKLLYISWQISRDVNVDIEKKVVSGVELGELPRALTRRVLRGLRGEVKGALEEVKEALFSTMEEYFKLKGERYRKCPNCGMPNLEAEKICVYCANLIG